MKFNALFIFKKKKHKKYKTTKILEVEVSIQFSLRNVNSIPSESLPEPTLGKHNGKMAKTFQ